MNPHLAPLRLATCAVCALLSPLAFRLSSFLAATRKVLEGELVGQMCTTLWHLSTEALKLQLHAARFSRFREGRVPDAAAAAKMGVIAHLQGRGGEQRKRKGLVGAMSWFARSR